MTMMKYQVQLKVVIDVAAEDGRTALPAATDFFQEAMDWALEHNQILAVKGVTWQPEILTSLDEEIS